MRQVMPLVRLLGLALLMLFLSACAGDAPTAVPPAPTSVPPAATAVPTAIPPTVTAEPTRPASTAVAATNTPLPIPTSAPTATPAQVVLWQDVTQATIGPTLEYTNKVELADINGDGLVDILFANGGLWNAAGTPELSRVFLNQGPDMMFLEVTEAIFGSEGMSAKVIKVRDVDNDGHADILVGTSYQTQSRLYLGDGTGNFSDVTQTHLPQLDASIGDLEFGDADGDGDLDVVLADWGPNDPLNGSGGPTRLWLNDGAGRFTDVTETNMPDVLVRFAFDLEFVDVDNDFDLDVVVACLNCVNYATPGTVLFLNDGAGVFSDVSGARLPQMATIYDVEAMDMNGNGFLDFLAVGFHNQREILLLNDGAGGYADATAASWPESDNLGHDDALTVFLDVDSDGDADFLIGSVDGPDRLLINDGAGNLRMVEPIFGGTPTKTCHMAVADLNGDARADVVQAQCPHPGAEDDRVYFGVAIEPDTAPPLIPLVESVTVPDVGQPVLVRARVHDNKSPIMPHDWQSVTLRWLADGETGESPMVWYGGYLWRGLIAAATPNLSYQVCATDAAGNAACSPLVVVE